MELVGWTTQPQERGPWGLRALGFTDLQISTEEVVVRQIGKDATVLYEFKKPVDIMLLVDLHLDTKVTTWRTRYFDPGHLARVHACNLHLRAPSDAIKIGELGIQQHVARESLMTTPNEEDPESE